MARMDLKHVGITVLDLEKMIGFYESLGMQLKNRLLLDEKYCSDRYSLYRLPEGTYANICFIEADNGVRLELFQFNAPEPFIPEQWNRAGQTHICFATDDLEGIYQKVMEQGCEIVVPICRGLTQDYFFFRDPEGRLVEVGHPFEF